MLKKSNRIIRSIYDSNPQSGFVSRNLEKFLPILTTEEKQVIEDKKAKLKNLEFSDINVAPEDKIQAQILKTITQFLYPTQSTLPAQSKINPSFDINQIQVTCSNLYSNLSRFLSSGVSLINSEKAPVVMNNCNITWVIPQIVIDGINQRTMNDTGDGSGGGYSAEASKKLNADAQARAAHAKANGLSYDSSSYMTGGTYRGSTSNSSYRFNFN